MSTKREALKTLYPSLKWKKKVEAMSENQVIAIYLSVKRRGKL